MAQINFSIDLNYEVNEWGDTIASVVKWEIEQLLKKEIRKELKAKQAELTELIRLAKKVSVEQAIKTLESLQKGK